MDSPGLLEARRRIEAAARDRARELDLGGLRLTEIPEELSALTQLKVLYLRDNRIGDDGAKVFSALGLTALDLSNNRISDNGAKALAALTGLTSLSLSGNQISDDGANALAAMTGLTSFSLSGNQIGVDGAKALAALTGLTSLRLSSNQIGDDGARALTTLTGLTSLHLSSNQIGDDGARALTTLTGLTSLHLSSNQIGDDGAQALAALTSLISLYLLGNHVGNDGVRALAVLTGLTSLELSDNQIGDGGVQALTALTNLTYLYLSDNRIGADGVRALPALTSLTSLGLASASATDLSPLMRLSRLKYLDCSGCRLTAPVTPIWILPSLKSLILYETVLPGVPAEVLSPDPYTSCLESLRAHFGDLEAGARDVTEIKFMILGNGRVGKTQICRRLRGQPYDCAQPSTHGIEVSSAPLALSPTETIILKIWDFGGQDIYHGTHALFLRTRALFPVVWTPESDAVKEHEHGGFTFRNQPLGYWLAYVQTFGGPNSPVLVIQSQCDEPEQERLSPPVSHEALDIFSFRKLLHYSALNDRGRAALDEALADAVRWLRRQFGVDKIGKGRVEVKARLEGMYAAGNRLISQDEFLALCDDVSRTVAHISSPQFLLEYLHDTGTVFYRKGLFEDAIILDQAWALEAVYAVFDRNSKAFKNIERYSGRFRRSDLAQWVWQQHGKEEQELFLSFMQQCGICFIIREGYGDIEAEYIASDLLPRRDAPEIVVALRQKWDDRCDAEATLAYDLLPPGLMRSLISKIGRQAGLAAEYWRDGFYFYDERTGSRALVEQRWKKEGWGGEIRVQTQRGQKTLLLERILELIDKEHDAIGARPNSRARRVVVRPEDMVMVRAAEIKEPEFEGRTTDTIKPAHEPSTKPEYFVSYAWGDDTPEGLEREAEVNRFCDAAAAKGIEIIRDRTAMHPGDRISKFIKRIGRGDLIFIFMSDKYLKSTYCMTELFEIWRNCGEEDVALIQRTRIRVLPCARIETFEERTQYVLYWNKKLEEMDARVKNHGLRIIAIEDLLDYRRMETFVGKTPDMLRLVKDILKPRKFEDFIEYGLDDPPEPRT
jgi:internalin A